jgi:hypothetical protein
MLVDGRGGSQTHGSGNRHSYTEICQSLRTAGFGDIGNRVGIAGRSFSIPSWSTRLLVAGLASIPSAIRGRIYRSILPNDSSGMSLIVAWKNHPFRVSCLAHNSPLLGMV